MGKVWALRRIWSGGGLIIALHCFYIPPHLARPFPYFVFKNGFTKGFAGAYEVPAFPPCNALFPVKIFPTFFFFLGSSHSACLHNLQAYRQKCPKQYAIYFVRIMEPEQIPPHARWPQLQPLTEPLFLSLGGWTLELELPHDVKSWPGPRPNRQLNLLSGAGGLQ